MVPVAQLVPDGLHRALGHLPDHIGGDLSGQRDVRRPLAGADLLRGDAIGPCHLGEDALHRHLQRLRVVEDVPDGVLGDEDRGRAPDQELVGLELLHHPFQLPDVGFQLVGDVLAHLRRHIQVHQLRLPADDGHPGLEVRRLDIRQQAPFKPGLQPVLQRLDLLRGPVGGQDDLLAVLMQRLKGVEELLLCALLAADKLDIVHQQHICRPVLVVELVGGVVADRLDDLIGELLPFDVDAVVIRVVFLDLVHDGQHQMGFAQPGPAVDEQRVVRLGGVGRHRLSRRMGKLVGVAHDKGGKGVLIVAALAALFDLLRAVPVEGGALLIGGEDGVLTRALDAQDLHLCREAHHLAEPPGEHIEVFFGHHILHKAGVHREPGLAVLKPHRLDRRDPQVIGHRADLFSHILFDQVKYFRKGIHSSTLSFRVDSHSNISPARLWKEEKKNVEKSVESVENLFFHSFSRPSHSRNVQNLRLYFIIKPPLFQSFQQHFEPPYINSIAAGHTVHRKAAAKTRPARRSGRGFPRRPPAGKRGDPLTNPSKRGFPLQKNATKPPLFKKSPERSPFCTKPHQKITRCPSAFPAQNGGALPAGPPAFAESGQETL